MTTESLSYGSNKTALAVSIAGALSVMSIAAWSSSDCVHDCEKAQETCGQDCDSTFVVCVGSFDENDNGCAGAKLQAIRACNETVDSCNANCGGSDVCREDCNSEFNACLRSADQSYNACVSGCADAQWLCNSQCNFDFNMCLENCSSD